MKKTLKKLKSILSRYWKILLVLVLVFGLFYYFILRDLPSPTKLKSENIPQSSEIFDRNGKLLYTIYAQKNQTLIPLSEIPKSLQEATIAVEDKDFYNHGAIDLRGIARAAVAIALHHQIQGGSTITQQLVKNTLLTPQQTIPRKIKEIILSFITEALYSKNTILQMYLNQVPYGGTAWGVEAASETYFGKHARNLDLAEASLLAGLPEAPSTFSPFGSHPELATLRQEEILKKMYDQGYINKNQMTKAIAEKLHYKSLSDNIKAPHFVLYIKDLLVKRYGETMVEEGGLKITTSLDLSIQNFAQKEVADQIAGLAGYHVTNGAALVTDPATGEILAMVGSRNYFSKQIDGNVNVTLAHRQPGSSIKPINYAVGLMNGYTAATPFIDERICFPNPGHQPYCPVNYDGKWHGVVQMRFALANSINIPAVKMLKLNGVEAMIATASAMGITTFGNPNRYGLSLTLGGGEVTMLNMATAYGVLANEGYRVNLHPILKVADSKGKILQEYKPPQSPIFGTKVLPTGVSYIISSILSDNSARAMEFGTASPLNIPGKTVAVKTGTTNDFRDNWTIGYTPSYLVAVWVGNNDNSPMQGLVSGITGAAPIWHSIMKHLLENKPDQSLERPGNIIQKNVCATSGLLPPPEGTPTRCPTRFEYFIKGTEPRTTDPGTQKVWIDKTTNDLPAPGQTNNLELKDEIMVQGATGDKYCITCSHPTPTPTP